MSSPNAVIGGISCDCQSNECWIEDKGMRASCGQLTAVEALSASGWEHRIYIQRADGFTLLRLQNGSIKKRLFNSHKPNFC